MKSNVFNILKKELKETFRDKKSLAMMLIVPIMIPLLVLGLSALFESEVNKSVKDYNTIGFDYKLSKTEKSLAKEAEIKVVEKSKKELKEAYKKGDIDLYVTKSGSKYTLNGEENDTTTYATALVEGYFAVYKEYLQSKFLSAKNIPEDEVLNIITVEKKVIEKENFYASYITNYAFLFIIMAITISSTYPATDATAGEKERGTLETLLTFPIKSKDIIVGKFLSVSLASIVTGLISLILMILSLVVAGDMFTIYKEVKLIPSITTIVYAFLVIVSYSFLISGLCIAIASKSKTFKEAQSALTPITFISFFPSFIAFMMDIKINTISSLIPFLNFTLIFTDITSGNMNFFYIFLMMISTIITITLVLMVIIREYKSEKVLFSN